MQTKDMVLGFRKLVRTLREQHEAQHKICPACKGSGEDANFGDSDDTGTVVCECAVCGGNGEVPNAKVSGASDD